ncbi:MAG: zinc ribbon domain-containing protein [Deltaproteobacteria bacterium]|nr:zinc ribbon domain-containing protein [Deltaproteobacteria bacterium]
MPIFDYICLECGKYSEILLTGSSIQPQCASCGSNNLKKLLSAHSSMSGPTKSSMPGPGDTSCCGSNPSEAGCAGPGSCCGKN